MKFNLAAVFTVVFSVAIAAESKLKPPGTQKSCLVVGKQQDFGLSIDGSFR